MGLRQEILERLQTTEYESLDAAAEAAVQAEEYLKSVKMMQTNHIQVGPASPDEAVTANAATAGKAQALKDMEKRGIPRGRTRSRDSDVCFKCNRRGHWTRECPQASRSSSISRSTSRGRRNPNYDNKGDIHSKMDKLLDLMSQITTRERGRQRSFSRGRRFSRSRSQSRSRYQSRERPRSRSRGRSQSRGRRQQSRSQSRHRSNSKNGRR